MGKENDHSAQASGINLAQVAAAALAAITAAVLGAGLGIAGTIAGAGIASVVTTVGSELYLRWLHRSRDAARKTKDVAKTLADPRAKKTRVVAPVRPSSQADLDAAPASRTPGMAAQRRTPHPPTRVAPIPPDAGQQPVTARQHTAAGRRDPAWPTSADHATARLPVAGAGASGGGERTVLIPRPGGHQPPQPTETTASAAQPSTKRRSLRWPIIVGTSAIAFVIGMLALTGFEVTTGNAVSGGPGSTIGNLVRGGAPHEPADQHQDDGSAPGVGPGGEQTPAPTTSKRPAAGDGNTPTTSGARPTRESAPTRPPATQPTEQPQHTEQPVPGDSQDRGSQDRGSQDRGSQGSGGSAQAGAVAG